MGKPDTSIRTQVWTFVGDAERLPVSPHLVGTEEFPAAGTPLLTRLAVNFDTSLTNLLVARPTPCTGSPVSEKRGNAA